MVHVFCIFVAINCNFLGLETSSTVSKRILHRSIDPPKFDFGMETRYWRHLWWTEIQWNCYWKSPGILKRFQCKLQLNFNGLYQPLQIISSTLWSTIWLCNYCFGNCRRWECNRKWTKYGLTIVHSYVWHVHDSLRTKTIPKFTLFRKDGKYMK